MPSNESKQEINIVPFAIKVVLNFYRLFDYLIILTKS